MSAFMCDYDHIDALLTAACDWKVSYRLPGASERTEITTGNATEIGRILLAENARSIAARYGDDESEYVKAYKFRPFDYKSTGVNRERYYAVSIIKGCDCFDYQACETDDYEETLAYLIIDRIRATAASKFPGYDEAPGWTFKR